MRRGGVGDELASVEDLGKSIIVRKLELRIEGARLGTLPLLDDDAERLHGTVARRDWKQLRAVEPRHAGKLPRWIAGEDAVTELDDLVSDGAIEITDGRKALHRLCRNERMHRKMERVFGLLNDHENVRNDVARKRREPDLQARMDVHRQRAGIAGD